MPPWRHSPSRCFKRMLACCCTLVVHWHLLIVYGGGGLYQANSGVVVVAATSSVYNHNSPFVHRRYDQTSLLTHKDQFAHSFQESVGEMRTSLKSHADNFDGYFRHLIKEVHSNFDAMFTRTYGLLYDRYSWIFSDMFYDLDKYYTTGTVDITTTMKYFFSLLYKKIFEELNSQYAFDSKYLNCTVAHMEEMKPFGEEPQTLILQIKRTFVAVRTFVQSLNFGSEILKTIMEVPVTSNCASRLQSIYYCKKCNINNNNNNNRNSICQDVCISLINRACLPYITNLNREWNVFLTDVSKLASRLKTSFNPSFSIEPIHIKISGAIMTFQENGKNISQRLFSKCGKPAMNAKTNRMKRHAKHAIVDTSQYTSISQANNAASTTTPSSVIINEFIEDLQKSFRSYKNFWSQLSKELCSEYNNQGHNCTKPVLRNSESKNYRDQNNMEIINQQLKTLRQISTNLNHAYNGLEVDIASNLDIGQNEFLIDDESSDGSGEGSGEGSGDDPFITNDGGNNNGDESSSHVQSSTQSTTGDFYFNATTTSSSTVIMEIDHIDTNNNNKSQQSGTKTKHKLNDNLSQKAGFTSRYKLCLHHWQLLLWATSVAITLCHLLLVDSLSML